MTGPRGHHDRFEELISASLSGDLSELEAAELEAHLADCPACTATAAAFGEQRRLVAGLRPAGPPRDLGARVRGGIASGAFGPAPWWRRGWSVAALGGALAVVAGALVGIVLLNALPGPQVGVASPTPPEAPLSTVVPSPQPTAEPSPLATPAEEPTEPPPELAAEPDLFLAFTGPFDNLLPTVRDGRTGETLREMAALSGPPVAAALSPDGQWLAYIAPVGEKGTHEVWATRVADAPQQAPGGGQAIGSPIPVGESVLLGESLSGSPFLEVLAWQPEGRYLAYALADAEGGRGTDVWLFEPGRGEWYQQTASGSGYVGSWVPGDAGSSCLWVSVAGPSPASHLVCRQDDAAEPQEPMDPADAAVSSVSGAFQPLVNASGTAVIFWRGVMDEQAPGDWIFSQGGAPYIASARVENGTFGWGGDQPLFSDLTIGRDAFVSAAITWGPDADAYAVWNATWAGVPQSPDGTPYPDPRRVYFGHASDARLLTRFHALDEGDVPADGTVVDVAIAPTGRHLMLTVRYPVAGELEAPRADLLLVTRNTGDVADEVEVLGGGAANEGWYGPAVYP